MVFKRETDRLFKKHEGILQGFGFYCSHEAAVTGIVFMCSIYYFHFCELLNKYMYVANINRVYLKKSKITSF